MESSKEINTLTHGIGGLSQRSRGIIDQPIQHVIDRFGADKVSVNGAATLIALAAFATYQIYTTIQLNFEEKDYLLPHGKEWYGSYGISEELFHAFIKMRTLHSTILADQEHGIDLPFPEFWETESDRPYKLKLPISRMLLVQKYKQITIKPTILNAHTRGVAIDIVKGLLSSLEYENSLFWTAPQRHPYTLFAQELMHWATTEFLHYPLGSAWALEQLRKRIEYITCCANAPYLIPSSSEITDVPNQHPAQVIGEIIIALKALSQKNKIEYQKLEFQQDLQSTCNAMNSVVREVLLLQYEMILPHGMLAPTVAHILKETRTDLKPAIYATIIHKRIKAFCSTMNIDNFNTIGNAVNRPQSIQELEYVLTAIKMNSQNKNGNLATGLYTAMFDTDKTSALLNAQEPLLIELAKWLILQETLEGFRELRDFKGDKWALGALSGKQLLLKIITLIAKSKEELRAALDKFHTENYIDVLVNTGLNEIQKEKKQASIHSADNIRVTLDQISINLTKLSKHDECFENRVKKMRECEERIYTNLKYLSSLFDVSIDELYELNRSTNDEALAHRTSAILSEPDIFLLRNSDGLLFLRQAQLGKTLNLQPEDLIIPSTIASCDKLINSKNKRQQVIGYCFKLKMLDIGCLKAKYLVDNNVSINESQISKDALTLLDQNSQHSAAIEFVFKVIDYFLNILSNDQEILKKINSSDWYSDQIITTTLSEINQRNIPIIN